MIAHESIEHFLQDNKPSGYIWYRIVLFVFLGARQWALIIVCII